MATSSIWKRDWQRSKDDVGDIVGAAKPSDMVMLGYFCLVIFALALFASSQGAFELELLNLTILAVLALVVWLDARHHGPSSAFVHAWFPVAFVLVGYFEIAPMVARLHPDGVSFDGQLHAIDLLIGNDPTTVIAHHASRAWAEVLTLCYASYFFLPVILAASLYARRRAFDRIVVTLAFAFSLNFLFYLAIPALGPNRVADFVRPPAFDGYFFAARLQRLLSHMEGDTPDAFPSGHTLITLLVLALAWQMQRRLFWIFLPIGSGLIVATIYLRYHYLADFAFSIVLAPFCLEAGERLASHWRKS